MLDHDRFCNGRSFRCICVCEPFHLRSSVICSLVLFCPDYFLMTVEGKSYGARRAVGRIPVVRLCFKIVSVRGFWWLLTIRTKSSRSEGGGAHKTPCNFSRRLSSEWQNLRLDVWPS
jgi:hypothetical protein